MGRSHKRTVLSSEPLANRIPSHDHRTARVGAVCSRNARSMPLVLTSITLNKTHTRTHTVRCSSYVEPLSEQTINSNTINQHWKSTATACSTKKYACYVFYLNKVSKKRTSITAIFQRIGSKTTTNKLKLYQVRSIIYFKKTKNRLYFLKNTKSTGIIYF